MRGLMSYVAISQSLFWRNGVRSQAVTKDGKHGKREAVGLHFCGWWKFGLQARNDGIDALERQHHVGHSSQRRDRLRQNRGW